MNPSLNDAIALAAHWHNEQKDKSGQPYILHPIRVMLQMKTDTERIVAVLHDIIEDTLMTSDELREYGYSDEVVKAVDAVSKYPGSREPYFAYLDRVKENPLALKVKLADIRDNLMQERLDELSAETRQRLVAKYHSAITYLTEFHQ